MTTTTTASQPNAAPSVGFDADDLAHACVECGVPDGMYESLCIALCQRPAAPALPEPAVARGKNWRAMLQAIGGWDNDLISVPAGAVREIIKEVEALRAAPQPLAEVSAAQAVPEGFALVPVKATAEMIQRGGHMNSEWLNDNAPLGECRYQMPIQSIWGAMLQVAGKPPSAQPTDTTREA